MPLRPALLAAPLCAPQHGGRPGLQPRLQALWLQAADGAQHVRQPGQARLLCMGVGLRPLIPLRARMLLLLVVQELRMLRFPLLLRGVPVPAAHAACRDAAARLAPDCCDGRLGDVKGEHGREELGHCI